MLTWLSLCVLDLRIVESVEIRWKGGQIQWLEILGVKGWKILLKMILQTILIRMKNGRCPRKTADKTCILLNLWKKETFKETLKDLQPNKNTRQSPVTADIVDDFNEFKSPGPNDSHPWIRKELQQGSRVCKDANSTFWKCLLNW